MLETRVAELEAQLADEVAKRSRGHAALAPAVDLAPIPRFSPADGVPLEVENEALRTQLHEERLHSAALKTRLGALEYKFSRLEALFSAPTPSASPYSTLTPLPPLATSTRATASPGTPQTILDGPPPTDSTTTTENSRLVAREVDSSLQRKFSPSLSTSRSPATSPIRTRPTLHQILSSLSVAALSSSSSTSTSPTHRSTSLPLRTRGPTGSRDSRSRRPTARRLTRPGARRTTPPHLRRSTCSTATTCSRTSKVPRYQLFVRR